MALYVNHLCKRYENFMKAGILKDIMSYWNSLGLPKLKG